MTRKSPNSLNAFFERSESTDLDNCDREQIHLSGRVQECGGLLAIRAGDQKIVAASANIGNFLDLDGVSLADAFLADVSETLAEQVADLSEESQLLHEVLDFEVTHDGMAFDAVSHSHGGHRFIEFVSNVSPSAHAIRRKMRAASKACALIMHAPDFDSALQSAAEAAAEITGYDRVKIYRFLPDWSGEVIAESRKPDVPSFMGLHFPAGDIPKQVRQIMSMVPYRSIGTVSDASVPVLSFDADADADADAEDIDLTWSVTRSVSTMHTAYLRNMGLGASFSCSLIYEGALWGLIAAHNRSETPVPFDCWSLLHEIGSALMLRFGQQERTSTAEKISDLRRIESHFASALREHGDVEVVIRTLVPVLQDIMNADGFAFQYGSNVHTSGRTPPAEVIPDMIRWAMKKREEVDQFQTTAFHREWPPARQYMDTACGVLIQPIAMHRVCQLIWFRGPITRTVNWAGKPDEKGPQARSGTIEALGPRRSFDRWIQEHSDESLPWQRSELESAKEIFKEFLDIITAQLLLKEENKSLQAFAATAAHDMTSPLRNIRSALQFMEEDAFKADSVKEFHAIAGVEAQRLMRLTEGLLELAVVRDQKHVQGRTDLGAVLDDVLDTLAFDIQSAEAEVKIGPLPEIRANDRLMYRLFLNLIGNAIKYRDPDRALTVDVSARATLIGDLEIAVADNGPGIDPAYAKRVFMPMQRLHRKDEIEGTGLGLAICSSIAEHHEGSIRLDCSHTDGARFVLTLPKAALAEVPDLAWKATG